jgi:glycosyltransferase involved in cell wall biosynthesis
LSPLGDSPLVSIVIPTFNSASTISRCLASIRKQTYQNIEVIIVDKGSRDGTVEEARRFGCKVYVIRATERSEQMNYGARMARGKYLYIVNSDFVLEQTVIEEAVEVCEEKELSAVCVHNTSDPSVSFWARVRKMERDCYIDDDLNIAARFFDREVFLSLGGYDERLIAGEDYELHNRLVASGFRVGRIRGRELHIGEPRDLRDVINKHYYYGKTLPRFVTKSRVRGLKQLSPIRPAYLRHLKEMLRDPILLLGFLVYQIIRYLSALIGYIAAALSPPEEEADPWEG